MRILQVLQLLTSIASAKYVIYDDYPVNNPTKWASKWDFETIDDPTHGFVNYIDQTSAITKGLLKTVKGEIYVGVDYTHKFGTKGTDKVAVRGRDSLRLKSKKAYRHGLFVLDISHMPGNVCGGWPAFWMLGLGTWPSTGEIDVVEGVSLQVGNSYAMHTSPGCKITNTGKFAGSLQHPNCDVTAKDQPRNAGCQILSHHHDSYGHNFNSHGGGIYATEWTKKAVSVWFFPRKHIPPSLKTGKPNPAEWGKPDAQFTGACDLDKYIADQKLMFDITFCGEWAGEQWAESGCKARTKVADCETYVRANPKAFKKTYWKIKSLKVYKDVIGAEQGKPKNRQPGNTKKVHARSREVMDPVNDEVITKTKRVTLTVTMTSVVYPPSPTQENTSNSDNKDDDDNDHADWPSSLANTSHKSSKPDSKQLEDSDNNEDGVQRGRWGGWNEWSAQKKGPDLRRRFQAPPAAHPT